MNWLTENWSIVAAVIAAVVAVLNHLGKAKAAGLLAAVIEGVEAAGEKRVKQAIQSNAAAKGVEGALSQVVKKLTAGAAVLCLAFGVAGCTTMDRTFAAAHGILGIAEGAYEDGRSVLEETGFVKEKAAPPATPPAQDPPK